MAVWTRLLGPFQRHFRRQRANTILERFPDINQAVVINIGGSLHSGEPSATASGYAKSWVATLPMARQFRSVITRLL